MSFVAPAISVAGVFGYGYAAMWGSQSWLQPPLGGSSRRTPFHPFRGHHTNEAAPQTDEHVNLGAALSAGFRWPAAQGKDTYGFLPLHPFLPLAGHPIVRSPWNCNLRPGLFLLADEAPAPLARMRWRMIYHLHEWDHRKAIAWPERHPASEAGNKATTDRGRRAEPARRSGNRIHRPHVFERLRRSAPDP